MTLKELISNAEEKNNLAYERQKISKSAPISAMIEYYTDLSKTFFHLLEELKKIDSQDTPEKKQNI